MSITGKDSGTKQVVRCSRCSPTDTTGIGGLQSLNTRSNRTKLIEGVGPCAGIVQRVSRTSCSGPKPSPVIRRVRQPVAIKISSAGGSGVALHRSVSPDELPKPNLRPTTGGESSYLPTVHAGIRRWEGYGHVLSPCWRHPFPRVAEWVNDLRNTLSLSLS